VECLAFARYDAVVTPDAVNQDITRWTGGARYYFADNLALHLEYSRRTLDTAANVDPTEDLVTARLDLGF
jgi:phosphate-selective porin